MIAGFFYGFLFTIILEVLLVAWLGRSDMDPKMEEEILDEVRIALRKRGVIR